MNKRKQKIIILVSIILFILIIGLLILNNNSSNYLEKINFKEIKEKINKKESFVLCISRTTCTHCNSFKPKLKSVANKYKTKIYYIDIDKESDNDQKEISSLLSFDGSTPTTIFIKEGEEKTSANRIEGDTSTKIIIRQLKKNNIIK